MVPEKKVLKRPLATVATMFDNTHNECRFTTYEQSSEQYILWLFCGELAYAF